MANKISDRELLKIIYETMDADAICQQTNIKLKTLQTRVAKLTYKKLIEDPSKIKGLYKPQPKVVKFSQNSIIIPKTRIEDSDFRQGDKFRVAFDDRKIILTKIQ
jgi:hypothetical protein